MTSYSASGSTWRVLYGSETLNDRCLPACAHPYRRRGDDPRPSDLEGRRGRVTGRPGPSRGRLTRVHTRPEPPERAADTGTNGGREPVQRWRLVVRREPLTGDLAQREQLSAWDAALAASGLPLAGLDAAKPKARIAIAAPLSASMTGEAELIDVWLTERLPRWQVREGLEGRLPAGFTLVDLHDVWLGEAPLPGRVAASVFRAVLSVDPGALASAANRLMAATGLPRERRKGENVVSYDLRPFLGALEVREGLAGGAVLRMTLLHDPAKGVGRPDEALLALGDVLGVAPLAATELVRESLVLADPPPAEPAGPRGPRRQPPVRSPQDPRSRPPRAGGH